MSNLSHRFDRKRIDQTGSKSALCASNSPPQIWLSYVSPIWLRKLLCTQVNGIFFFFTIHDRFLAK
jgi:hypothetical protein